VAERLPRITAAQLLAALRRAGWYPLRQRGSHLRLAHSSTPARITVAIHAGRIVKPATLRSILEQADLSVDDLIRLLYGANGGGSP
jgi:predicted RNA binding protein YcfA (HicA-like mRNA interferase family)